MTFPYFATKNHKNPHLTHFSYAGDPNWEVPVHVAASAFYAPWNLGHQRCGTGFRGFFSCVGDNNRHHHASSFVDWSPVKIQID